MTRNFKALIVCVCLSLWASALSAQEHWTFDYRQFQYDMTVYFSLQNGDAMVANPANYEVAAFVGDECRGVAVFEDQIGQNGVALKYGYLKVYSNEKSGETIVLKCFDKDVAKERDFADVALIFQNDSHVGYPSTPLPLVLQYQIEAQSAYADMGTVEGSGIKKSGLSAKVTAIPNEGYKFVRWSNGMTGNPYTFVVEKDVSLTAEFAPKEYTLTFVLDNGQDNIVLKQDYKSMVTAPTGLEKLGFTFKGWDIDVPATTPARDVTFTAQWSRNSYNLKFMSGDEVLSEQPVLYEGDVVTPATNPTKEGYTFTGWSPVLEMTMPAHDQTYTAQFTVNQYKVTFMANGKFVKNEYQDYGSTIVAPEAPTEGGYTFLGWKPNVDATVPAHDVIYTASYDRNDYFAAFIVDGEVKQNNQVTFGESIVAPTDPEKEGYTFKGWQPAIPETMPDYDMAFTAKFEVNSYDVTWKVDDKTFIDRVSYLSDIVVPADPVKEGYTFTGWTPEVPTKMPAEDQTFTAQFVVNKYLLKFIIDEDVQEDSLAYGAAITATVPVKDGYTFAGWNPVLSDGTTMPARDMTYTAQFTVNSYHVTFLLGTDTLSTTTQDFGSEIGVPNAPQKVGFTFKEWQPEVPATLPSHDVAFTALYERNNYLSVFVVDGDTLKADSLAYEAKVLPPANPEKVGYTFTGWQPEVLESMPANDVTYTAQFTPNKYLATFVVDGEILKSDSVLFNTAITKPDDPVKTGYTFTGWDPVVPEVISASDMTFTAQFTVNKYNVTFIADGETLKSEKQDYGTAIVAPQAPLKVGHSCTGWDPEVPELVPDSDVVFTALFIPNKYLATFVVDGEILKSDSIVFNTAITKPVDPVKTGYTFTGWDPVVPEVISASDMTFTAQFTVNKYNVTFIADGETLKSEKQDYGTAIVAPQAPLKVGHSFTGWDPEVPELVPDSDVVFTAQFAPNKYLATFVVDGEILKSDSVLFNTAITKPDDPVKTGYTFTGWDPVVPEVISASDMTFTAQFTVNKYNVTFIADGETLKSEKQDYGTLIVAPEVPNKEGYSFAGWDPQLAEGATVPDSAVTYVAVYTVNKYYIIYIVNGQEWAREEVVYGDSIVLREYTPDQGYVFNGWVSDQEYKTMPAHDVTYTANIATGIDALFKNAEYVDVYTISGKLVGRQKTLRQVKQLPRGLYIVNGKRIVMK